MTKTKQHAPQEETDRRATSEEPISPSSGGSTHRGTSSTYDFFRRWQRPIIWTAGIFTLLVFSVSSEVVTTVSGWFAPPYPMPSLTLKDGKKVIITEEDMHYGRFMRELMRTALVPVIPDLAEDQQDRDMVTRLASL